ncbi:MAG: sigma-70 family RNA polymerase sigma factor [Actinobacteria bacterium]|nr:sigma-70 family RNA polymerase sigma factor [Actinomycetota bacterium]
MGKLNEQETSELMRAALAGDKASYRAFFETILPILKSMINAMAPTLSPDLREDIVQEVLTSIHAKRHTWQQDRLILPWIYAIVRYRLIDFIRKEKRTPKSDSDIAELEVAGQDDANLADLRIDIEKGLRSLNAQTEAVVRAVGIEGKDAKKISQELGISEHAARIAFHRGLKKMKAFFLANE